MSEGIVFLIGEGILLLILIATLLIYGFLIYYGFVSFRRKYWFRAIAVMLFLLYSFSFWYTRWTIEKAYCYVDGVWMC